MASELYNNTSGVSVSSPLNNLPKGLPIFLGRETEILQIKKLLNAKRLVTLFGTGGVGKTCLAIQVADELLEQFSDGVFFVPLDSIVSSEFIVDSIAITLGIKINPRLNLLDQFLTELSSKNLLLILDGFQNVLDKTLLLAQIIDRAPSVKILVTTREPLNFGNEAVVDLHGLPMPERDSPDAETYPSIQLFLQCARIYPDFEPDLEVIGHICRLVDGMPLAIELASAWASALSCEQIAQRIEQSLSHHPPEEVESGEYQSMIAIFDSVWGLFSETEKRILMGLSVFKDGFSHQAAGKIIDASSFFLDGLLNKRLIQHNKPNRYTLHLSFSQYLQEKLLENPVLAMDIEIRHGSFYLGLLRDSEFSLKQSVSALPEDILSDVDNIRIAWKRTASAGNLRFVRSALSAWMIILGNRGWFREAIDALNQLSLRLSDFSGDDQEAAFTYVQVKIFLGEFYYQLGDYQSGIRELQNGVQRINGIDYLTDEPEMYRLLGNHYSAIKRYEDSKEMYRHGLVLAEKLGNLPLVYQITNSLGAEAHLKADYQGAIPMVEHALEIARQLEDKSKIVQSLNDLGNLYYEIKEYPRAKELLTEALARLPDDIGKEILKRSILDTMEKILAASEK
jgi:tetratricopeptide (TPR) repeat protein